MADNTRGGSQDTNDPLIASDEVTYSGETADVQLVRIVNVTGAEGSKTVEALTTGVQYVEDSVIGTTGQGTLVVARRDNALAALAEAEGDAVGLRVDGNGALWVTPNTSGDVAHDAVDSGNPVKVGGKARSSAPTAVANDDRVNAWFGRSGELVVGLGEQGNGGDGVLATAVVHPMNLSGGTAGGLAVMGHGFNGTSWDRVRVANTGRLQVDVVTAPSSATAGDVAHDAVDSGNPVKVGGLASAAFPTAVANNDRVNAHFDTHGHLGVWSVPHEMGGLLLTAKTAQYTTAQTGTALWTPAAGKRVVATSIQIQSAGVTAGTCIVWFGTSGDTTYTRGTDLALFDGEFAPSSTSKPGFALAGGVTPIGLGANDHVLRVTTTNAQTVTITVWGYEV